MTQKSITHPNRAVLVFMAEDEFESLVGNVLSGQRTDAIFCHSLKEIRGKATAEIEAILVIGSTISEKDFSEIAENRDALTGLPRLPIIVAAEGGADSPLAAAALQKFENVFVLGYPFTQASIEHTLHIAFRTRESQRRFHELSKEHEGVKNELRESRDQIETRVNDRTAELTGTVARLRRLTGEMILSEQRDRRRLAGILHDHLQQLLVSAKYRVAALSRLEDPGVKSSAGEIEELLGEVIEASRSLTSDLYPPIVHESGLRTIMEWLVSFMAAQSDFTVQLKMEDDIGETDENSKVLLFESVRELLLNALKHARVRSAEVSIRKTAGGLLEVAVADQGPGFDTDLAEQIGIGLFRIRERLKLAGGRLDIRSASGSGSRISILMPLPKSRRQARPVPVEANSPVRREAMIPRSEKPVNSTIRVLIADDHAVMRQGLSISLSQEPDIVIVGEAFDGKMALDKARNLRPDVVLMDLGMPQMNGIEATQKIHSEMPRIRVIGLSMFEENEGANAMFRAGAVAYLSKSCSVHALTATIRRCVGKSDLRAQ